MADRLYLSFTLRGFNSSNMLRHYERMLRIFPFSRLSAGASVLSMIAVSESEPPLFEQSFDNPPDPEAVIAAARQFSTADCSVQLGTRWDLWQFDKEWALTPTPVTLICTGPEFETDERHDLQIDFGIDSHFLPQRDLPNHLFMARSNIRSLLHLVAELEKALTVETKRLWSESGGNFAERLQRYLDED
jgi:hypothetical protein